MKMKSGLNFLGYKFSMELVRTEGVVCVLQISDNCSGCRDELDDP